MTLKEKLILKFKKSQAVRVRIYTNDHRVVEKVVIPNNSQVTVSKGVYVLSKEKYTIEKGIPTYTFIEDRPDAIDLVTEIEYGESDAWTAKEVKAHVESNYLQKIMETAEGGTSINLQNILIGVTVLIMLIGFYFLYQEIASLQELINDIHEIYYTGGAE